MRTQQLLPFVILALILSLLISCSKSEEADVDQNDYFWTFKIDGDEINSSTAAVSVLADQTMIYTITSIDDTGNSMTISLNSPTAEGTFASTENGVSISYTQSSPLAVWAANEAVGSGTVTISESNSTYMEGSFSFNGVNQADGSTKVISDGEFKAEKL